MQKNLYFKGTVFEEYLGWGRCITIFKSDFQIFLSKTEILYRSFSFENISVF